ncbi:MAG: type III-B CRISPR module RAMP protein Cmr6 [Rhodocyclaceae bacterium]|nr:type III-B CRISPR module RAMP protein Cmr6 [Rhodocyclaceae bacterium]
MPIAAVPNYLGTDFRTASPGMRFGMYLKLWEGSAWSKSKDKPLDTAKTLTPNDQQTMHGLLARQKQTFDTSTAPEASLRFEAIATAPFTTGLGNEHPLENGFAFLNPYGLPYLPGSGIKGVLRQAARELASDEWGSESEWEETAITFLFGKESADGETEHQRGALTFWDVIPQIKGDKLAVEIMTPHQSHYYQQKNDRKAGNSTTPHESGQPNPITFLTVPHGSGFVFHVQCNLTHLNRLAPELVRNEQWKTLLKTAFEHAFEWLGFGAKTAVGYGAMQSEAQRLTQKEMAEKRKVEEKEQQKVQQAAAREQNAIEWQGTRIKFDPRNKSLTVEKDGKTAIAIQPEGENLLATLPPAIQAKIRQNQFTKVTAYIADSILMRVTVP